MKPNLFKYATSELSQDAFICWLLEWANPENENEDRGLHKIGTLLIDEFFRLADIEKPFKYTSVVIKPQHKNIDILCVVNEEYAIIIEDKTDTSHHDKQLESYFIKIKDEKKYDPNKIIPIYFKTGEQNNYEEVKDAGYKLFLRNDFLNVLVNGIKFGVTNLIFNDYYHHLKSIDDVYNSYLTSPLNDWQGNHYSWIGFFIGLIKKLKNDANWKYISNANGGFYALDWKWKKIVGGNIYLQIEGNPTNTVLHTRILVRIEVYNEDNIKKMRDDYHLKALKIAEDFDIELKKPHYGKGKYMTVAILKDQYLVENEFGLIDLDKTVLNLQRMEKLIDKIE